MNPLYTDELNLGITDDSWNSTSDALLGEVHQIDLGLSMIWQLSNFSRWSIRMAENVTSFEDAEMLNLASPLERSFGDPQVFFETSWLLGESDRSLIYLASRTTTSPYIVVQDRVEPSSRQTPFSPDFVNVKKFVAYVIGPSFASPIEQRQPLKIKRNIPITVAPQVIHQAEEENLTEDLETALKFADETYSTLKRIEVNIEHDPEIIDRKTIRFTLTVSREPETVLEDEALFKRCLRSNIGARAHELITVTYNWEK